MPTEGFSTITVTTETYEKLKRFAERTKRSVPKAVEFLIEQTKKEPTP